MAYWGGSIPWVTTAQIDFNTVLAANESITELGLKNSAAKLLRPGTLLLALYGQGKTRGKVAILGIAATTNQACASIVVSDAVSRAYVFHYLASQYDAIRQLSNSGSQDNLNGQLVRSIQVPVPPLRAEQEAIAEALSDADALIESLEQLLAKKRQIKQGAMQELLTGQRRLPGFSEAWRLLRFGKLVSLRKERLDPRQAGEQNFCVELEHIEQGTGCLTGHTTTGDGSSLKSIFAEGDVLFGKLRAYLRKYWLATEGGVCSTEIWVLVAQRHTLIPTFLFQLVRMGRFIEVASSAYGTHMPRSDWSVVRNHEVAVPSVQEQSAIAITLADMDAELTALEARVAKTRLLKQGMAQALLTGRIRLV